MKITIEGELSELEKLIRVLDRSNSGPTWLVHYPSRWSIDNVLGPDRSRLELTSADERSPPQHAKWLTPA